MNLMAGVFATLTVVGLVSARAASVDSITVDQPVCFGREYSDKHLKSAPSQTVKEMKIKLSKVEESGDDKTLWMKVDAKIQNQKPESDREEMSLEFNSLKSYSADMICDRKSNTKLECFIECDGGRAEISWRLEKAGQEVQLKNLGFVLYGGCGSDAETIFLEPTKGGDDLFKLSQLPKEFCQN